MVTVVRPEWVVIPGERGPIARSGLAVAFEDRSIIAVGERIPNGDVTIDAPGAVLLPGLINGHTHLGTSPLGRGVIEDVSYEGLPFYMAVSPITGLPYEPEFREELRVLMAADVAANIRSGTTCVVNQNAVDADWLLSLLTESGIRAYSGPILPSSPKARGTLGPDGRIVREAEAEETLRRELADAVALHERWDQGVQGRIHVLVGPASAETCPDDLLLEMARLNAAWGVPLTLHLAQSEHDVAQAQAMFGTSSTAHLADLGLLGPNLIAAHGSLLSDDDVRLLAEAGATIAHCATRKAREAVFSPFISYIERGLRVIIANDAFNTDLIQEIRSAAMFGKLALGSSARPSAADALAAATSEAAAALGAPDLGRIEVGARADLTLVDLSSPFAWPVFDPIASLVYYATGADVRSVWVDGAPLVHDGRLLTLDWPAIAAKARAAGDRLWAVAVERGRLRRR
ncbi:MAG: ethylammeline chlorohydrolase [Dehalococcoidia bacterium]|nr:MAG: ethylammeline chlorohydrolase [Dehalococcoidia bacterium]